MNRENEKIFQKERRVTGLHSSPDVSLDKPLCIFVVPGLLQSPGGVQSQHRTRPRLCLICLYPWPAQNTQSVTDISWDPFSLSLPQEGIKIKIFRIIDFMHYMDYLGNFFKGVLGIGSGRKDKDFLHWYIPMSSVEYNSHLVQGVPSFPRQCVRPCQSPALVPHFFSLEIITIFDENRNRVYNGVSLVNM